MVYSQAKVIAGGLAHIPIVIAFFYFILTFFNKRALNYAESNKTEKDVKSKTEVKKATPKGAETKTVNSINVSEGASGFSSNDASINVSFSFSEATTDFDIKKWASINA